MRGELLRALRRERGWTQEEAAYRARVSEKLFRKAEQGGRVDGRSLAALAAIFAENARRSLTSQDLMLGETGPLTSPGCESLAAGDAESRGGISAACVLLDRWLRAIWERSTLDAINRWASPAIVFHCEMGILRGCDPLRRRYERLLADLGAVDLTIDALVGTSESAACRWRMRAKVASTSELVVGGMTDIRLANGVIHEASEFLDSRYLFERLAEGMGASVT